MVAPAQIGEYKVVRQLGAGGMGEVYLAEDPSLDRLVAVKLIAGFRDHPDARSRFAVEARAIGRLKHPNIVTVHRTGEDADGRPFLVSEFVEGTPLDKLERPIPRERAIAIGLQLARGLAAAHRDNILHRDVKPANAIVDRDGIVKLLDFGLARIGAGSSSSDHEPSTPPTVPLIPSRSDASTVTFTPPPTAASAPGSPLELTAAGAVLGTPRYMSPEAWEGRRLTPASDVFSLGLVLWELVANTDLAERAKDAPVPPIRTVVPDLAPELARVIDRATRRAADERYVDAGALLAALEEAAADRPVLVEELPPPPPLRSIAVPGAIAAVIASGAIVFAVTRDPDARAPVPPAPLVAPETAPLAPPAPRALTALGGCAETPAFIDGATIAFTLNANGNVDIFTTTGTGEPARVAATAGWDWRPEAGRLPGELLYIRDGADDRSELVAFDRASRTEERLSHASSAVTIGGTIFVMDDSEPGRIGKLEADNAITWIAKTPAAKTPYILGGAPQAKHLAIVVADPDSPPGLCTMGVAPPHAIACPTTDRLQNGRPAITRDGRYLYYPARSGIRVLDLTDGSDHLAVPNVRASGGITLSPDERRLVFSDCRTYGSIIAVGGTAKEPERLVGKGLVKHPAGASDGTLAWVAARGDAPGTRILVRAPGKPEREIAVGDGDLGRPTFDPTGALVAFSDGGIKTVSAAGGAITTWSTDAGDRNPVFVAGGGIAFTRLGEGGAPAIAVVDKPGAPPRTLVATWVVDDVDRTGTRLLAHAGQALATIEVATAKVTPVPLGEVGTHAIYGARIAPDATWAAVLGGPNAGTFYKIDLTPTRAAPVVVHVVAAGQTAGPPAILSDGRIAFRPEIWLGELYELTGTWATPAQSP